MKFTTIYFDMDGTIADFYSVPNWLAMLEASDPTPYKIAKPLVNLSRLARVIHILQGLGYDVGIISALSRSGSADFHKEIQKAKIDWLARHLPSVVFDEITFCPYGANKSECVLDNSATCILFDDEEKNRQEWAGESFLPNDIFSVLSWVRSHPC